MTSELDELGDPAGIGADDRHAARLGLEHAATERLGVRGVDEHVEATQHVRDVVAPTGERDPIAERLAAAAPDAVDVVGLRDADVTDDDEVGVADGPSSSGHRLDEHLEALARVEPSDDADEAARPGRPPSVRARPRRTAPGRKRARSTPGWITTARWASPLEVAGRCVAVDDRGRREARGEAQHPAAQTRSHDVDDLDDDGSAREAPGDGHLEVRRQAERQHDVEARASRRIRRHRCSTAPSSPTSWPTPARSPSVATQPGVHRQVERAGTAGRVLPVLAQRYRRRTGERQDDPTLGERSGEVHQAQLRTPHGGAAARPPDTETRLLGPPLTARPLPLRSGMAHAALDCTILAEVARYESGTMRPQADRYHARS